MHTEYEDITSRIVEAPSWYDKNGTPRYGDFHPSHVPNIYANEVVLLEIACQNCRRRFQVALDLATTDRINMADIQKPFPSLKDGIESGQIHYGDPPSHIEEDHAGSTMNCYDLRVLQYWRKGDRKTEDRWVRVPELEINLPVW